MLQDELVTLLFGAGERRWIGRRPSSDDKPSLSLLFLPTNSQTERALTYLSSNTRHRES